MSAANAGWSIASILSNFHPWLRYRRPKRVALNIFYRADWRWLYGEHTWTQKPPHIFYAPLPARATNLPKPSPRMSERDDIALLLSTSVHFATGPHDPPPDLSAAKHCGACGKSEFDDQIRWYTVLLCSGCIHRAQAPIPQEAR